MSSGMRKLKRKWVIAFAVVGLIIAVILLSDHLYRRYGPALSREEALERANAQLQYLFRDHLTGGTMPVLAEEQYDPATKTWILTFRNSNCEVSIIADRYEGTDIGGVSKGCAA